MDRLLVYACVAQDAFTLVDAVKVFSQQGVLVEPEAVKQSLQRLELAFVLARAGAVFRFQVPLQRELILADGPAVMLRTELQAFGAGP